MTSGGRREVLAEVSRMAGGTSPVGLGASGPPDMVHDGGAGRRWQGQRMTPAVTRLRAKRDGLWPGMFALMATQEDIARSIAELSPPDVVEQEVPSDLTCDMETPETYVQAHTGPHSDIWTEAEGKELRGLNATGTFRRTGVNSNEGSPNPLPKEVFFCVHRDFVMNIRYFLFLWHNSCLGFHCSCFSALRDTCRLSGKAAFSLF